MCSIAAGLRSRSSIVACIASATDAKKSRQTFVAGQGRDLELRGENRCERSFAACENVRQIIGSAQESFDAVARPAFDQSGRPTLGHLRPRRTNELLNLCTFIAQRFMARPNLFDATVGHDDLQ